MSGIFKGDSIYKSGGGGGGYKDGGQLVDNDFIEVKNNTVSSYENESRDPVNFYFDIKDGEILNSSIEFTTQVNTTVNVYYVGSGGLLIPVGYVGSNTANAGESYNIVIMGKSFILENVVEPIPDPDNILVMNDADGIIYPCKKLNGIYWSTVDYKKYCQWNETKTIDRPWRVPTGEEYYNLKSNYTVTEVTKNGSWKMGDYPPVPAPTNTTGLSFEGNGFKDGVSLPIQQYECFGAWWEKENIGGVNCFVIRLFQNMYVPSNVYFDYYSEAGSVDGNKFCSLRLIYDP